MLREVVVESLGSNPVPVSPANIKGIAINIATGLATGSH
jgi:hypothetical protein